ncbi:hypothetical protein DY000_02056014 [Brassica cretica]|uniref:RNase H type-1 domain-containing protein n=1 Tax=Brassica cretica TaxID=69181 RepID=A0ABQ7A484_BRACR|nr:hypothetical protein DY000_02056014 [Brassica cretica]
MIPGGSQWDRSKIQLLIPEYEEKVLCLKPSLSGAPDKLIWLVFEGFLTSPEDTLSSAIVLAREWCANSKPGKALSCGKRYHEIPPTPGATVIRSDAAWCSSTRKAGLGWCLNIQPQTRSFQKSLEFVSTPLMAEGLALREAVITCRRLELKSLRFESDSAQLIKSLIQSPPTPELHSIVADVLAFCDKFESVSFVWIPRLKNMVADGLAKEALFVVEPLVVVDAVNALN